MLCEGVTWGGICFHTHLGGWQSLFPCSCRTEGSGFCCQRAGGSPQTPLHMPFTTCVCALSLESQQESLPPPHLLQWHLIEQTIMTGIPSPLTMPVITKPQVPSALPGLDLWATTGLVHQDEYFPFHLILFSKLPNVSSHSQHIIRSTLFPTTKGCFQFPHEGCTRQAVCSPFLQTFESLSAEHCVADRPPSRQKCI